jgi:hypothetical protein
LGELQGAYGSSVRAGTLEGPSCSTCATLLDVGGIFLEYELELEEEELDGDWIGETLQAIERGLDAMLSATIGLRR